MALTRSFEEILRERIQDDPDLDGLAVEVDRSDHD